MLANGGAKIIPVIPHIIIHIKNALRTRDPEIVTSTLEIIQALVTSHIDVGQALIPHYN